MNRYVKIEGYDNWFLALEPNESAPSGISERSQKQLLSIVAGGLHAEKEVPDLTQRLVMAATTLLDYEALTIKYNQTLLIRPIGSYMTLHESNKIIEEKFSNNFPIDKTSEIVICENDYNAEHHWTDYLRNRFPNKEITVINFFNLRSDQEIMTYFEKAEYITFSTTFTDLEWFKKLDKFSNKRHKIIGHCFDKTSWNEALKVTNKEIEIINL